MKLTPDFRDALSAFNDAGVEYLVVGAFAMAAHGMPRTTGDIDFWVGTTPENAERVRYALAAFGAPGEMFEGEDLMAPDLILQVSEAPGRLDVITAIEGVTFDEAWPARQVVELDGVQMPVLSPEHLLRNKRAVGRPKDLVDVGLLERREGRRRGQR